jgi:electron transfer flavoprotein alpha subunit
VNGTDDSGAGAAVGTAGVTGPARTVFVVLEPVDEGDAGEPVGTPALVARWTLAAEAARLAAALGATTRLVTWPAGADVDFDALTAGLADLARAARPIVILVQHTDTGRQLAPGLARRLGSCAVLGCSDVIVRKAEGTGRTPTDDDQDAVDAFPAASPVFVKPVYGGWLEQEITETEDFVPVVTLALEGLDGPETLDAIADQAVEPEIVEYVDPLGPRVRHLETIPPDARSVDLIHSKRIVTAGMGTVADDLLAAVGELADLLEGSVGATRPVVDEGRLPKERLIGQTGRTVSPELYVALGVSGSPHHVAGVRKADRVLSVNRDVRAPIFEFSDVGYVADLEAVLPALIHKIREWRDAPPGDDHVE